MPVVRLTVGTWQWREGAGHSLVRPSGSCHGVRVQVVVSRGCSSGNAVQLWDTLLSSLVAFSDLDCIHLEPLALGRIDGIRGRSERPPERHAVWMPSNLRLSNKRYALTRPMAKLVLLQQLGISVPEIYSSKNLEHAPLVVTAAGQTAPVFPLRCAQHLEPNHVQCRDSPLTPVSPLTSPSPCVRSPPTWLWTQTPNPRCLLAGSS